MRVRIVVAAAAYFAAMFAVGFVLGPIRVIWLEPKLGAVAAALIEAPFLLSAMTIAAARIVRGLRIPANPSARTAMGLMALVFLQAAEIAAAGFVRGMAPGDYLASSLSPAGAVGLFLLAAFALAPVVVGRQSSGSASRRVNR